MQINIICTGPRFKSLTHIFYLYSSSAKKVLKNGYRKRKIRRLAIKKYSHASNHSHFVKMQLRLLFIDLRKTLKSVFCFLL